MTAVTDKGDRLRVWLIQHGEPLPVLENVTSFRTARLSNELGSRGHDVTYWCSSFWHHKKQLFCEENREIDLGNYKLQVLHAGLYPTDHSPKRYFHHTKMARLFAQEARKRAKPDVIVAALPIHYCAYEAVRYGLENRVPVIVDIRDYWPDNLLRLFPRRLQGIGRLVLRRDFSATRFALQRATALVAMMTDLLEWGLRNYAGRDRGADDRLFFLGGDKPSNDGRASLARLFPDLKQRAEGRFVVTYIGSFSFLNHPMVLIEAARHLNSIAPDNRVLFVLAGNGSYHQACVDAARGLNNITFVGWVDPEGIDALGSVSSVGVVPSLERFSFPNKAFSYLGAGLPVLSSEHGDLNELLEEYDAGFYFEIEDPTQLARKILELSQLEDQDFLKIKENAKSLFAGRLQAGLIYREYADHVEHLARENRNGNRA